MTTDYEPMTEREFLGLDTVINNSLVRTAAAEDLAHESVLLRRALRMVQPRLISPTFDRMVDTWEAIIAAEKEARS